jgi:hypothetical protein
MVAMILFPRGWSLMDCPEFERTELNSLSMRRGIRNEFLGAKILKAA